jgi:hypothetical protein
MVNLPPEIGPPVDVEVVEVVVGLVVVDVDVDVVAVVDVDVVGLEVVVVVVVLEEVPELQAGSTSNIIRIMITGINHFFIAFLLCIFSRRIRFTLSKRLDISHFGELRVFMAL